MSNPNIDFKDVKASPSWFAEALLVIIEENSLDLEEVISTLELWKLMEE